MSTIPHTLAVRQVVLFSSHLSNSAIIGPGRQHGTHKNAVAFLAQKPLQEPVSHEPKGPHKSNKEERRFSLLFIISMCVFTGWS